MTEILNKNAKEKLSKLKVQETFLTKSVKSSVSALKLCHPDLLSEIAALDETLQIERSRTKEMLHTKIVEIFERLQELQTNFNTNEKLKHFHADNCRENLLSLQKKISSLREDIEKQSYLMNEQEKKLCSEVELAQRRLEEGSHLEKHILTSIASSKVRKATSVQKHIKNQDIKAFENFVEKRGLTGGWEESDHLLFVRLRRRRFRGRDAFFAAVQAQLPDLSLELIEEHEKWYQDFENLHEKHKSAIEMWKTNKKKAELKHRMDNDAHRKSSFSSDSTENSTVKAEIEEWKKQRQLREEAMAKAEREKKEAEEAKQQLENRKKAQLRAAVSLYRQQKEKECQETKKLEEIKKEEEREEKAAQAKKLIKTFRKMDKLYVEKQKLLRERPSAIGSVLPKVAVSVEAKRDPVRVLQHTKVWQTHCKTKPSAFKPIIHLRNMPHLAVPDWRRGMV